MVLHYSIKSSSRASRLLQATLIACAAGGCGREFDLGEITQGLDEDGSGPAAKSQRSLDGSLLFASRHDLDVVVSDAAVRPAATIDILPIALGDVDGDGLGDWIQGDTLFYGAPRPDEGTELQVGGRARLVFEGSGIFRAAGDVNGDGLMDILFGNEATVWIASDEHEPVRELPVEQPPGRLVLGSRERLTGDVELASLGLAFGDRDALAARFGEEFARDLPDSHARQETLLLPLGDLDGDGFADFVSSTTVMFVRYLSDEYGSVGGAGQEIRRESVSYVHFGQAEPRDLAAPRARLDADARWAAAGDVDGDGFGDVIWTTPEGFSLLSGGVASVERELGLADAVELTGVAATFNVDAIDPRTGVLGDLDGDGFDDFAINGAMKVDSPTDVSTPWFLFYGGPDLLQGSFGTERAGAVIDTQLYAWLGSLGDWDDDGFSDLFLAQDLWLPGKEPRSTPADAREAVLLRGGAERFSGRYVIPLERPTLDAQSATYDLVPVPAGDLDGDGFSDMFVKGLFASSLDLGIIYGAPPPVPTIY